MHTHQISSVSHRGRPALAAVIALLLACFLPAAAQAQTVVKARAVPQFSTVTPGSRFAVAVVLDFDPGWHAWPNEPVIPDELQGLFSPVPTELHLAGPAKSGTNPPSPPAGWIVLTDRLQWPVAHEVTTAGLTGSPITILSYSDQSVIFVPVTLSDSVSPGAQTISFEVHYQACNDSVCLQPTSITAAASVTVAVAGTAASPNEPSLFTAFSADVFDAPVASPSAPASSAPNAPAPQAAASGASPASGSGKVLTLRAVPQSTPVHPGGQFAVAVEMTFGEGWHAWPNKPIIPTEAQDVLATPTEIRLVGGPPLPSGWKVHPEFAQWPEAKDVTTAAVSEKPITLKSYAGRGVVFVPVTLDASAAPGDYTLNLEIFYQACDDSICMRPTAAPVSVHLSVAPASAAVVSNEPDLFKPFDPSVFARIAKGDAPPSAAAPGDGAPPPPPASRTPPSPQADALDAAAPMLFGVHLPAPGSALYVITLLLAGVVGGAVLNVTPCVLPVIPIKIMTLSQHAGGSRARTLLLGAYMFLGVVVFWTACGIPMVLFKSGGDPSRLIFGTWWITFVLGLIVTAMGLGIMGLFQIKLPQSVYMIEPKVDSPSGSFVFGVLTAVLGLPCFGFVAGGLLAASATMPVAAIMAVFVGIGVGMGLPYLVLAAYPQLVEKIPRTGPASELVKQVMGLLLIAAAAFFVSAGLKTLLSAKPYLSETIKWWAVGFFVLLASLWLAFRTIQIAKAAWPRIVMPLVALLLTFVSLGYASSATAVARGNHERLVKAQADAAAAGGAGSTTATPTGVWLPYTEASYAQARASGKVIFLDFTADWCIICKVSKSRYLDTEPVAEQFRRDQVILFEVDLSNEHAPGWKLLNDLGRTAVPTIAVLAPGKEPDIFNAYTTQTIMNALERARAPVESLTRKP